MVHSSQNQALNGLKAISQPRLHRYLASCKSSERQKKIQNYQTIVGSIMLFYDALSVSSIRNLLHIQNNELEEIFPLLHPILNIPRTKDGTIDSAKPITFLNLSFCDDITIPDQEEGNQIVVGVADTHRTLYLCCIRLLEQRCLKENVCNVSGSGTRRSNVASSTVEAALPEAAAYACSHWVQHLVESKDRIVDGDTVHNFLTLHLLHWMEALSWLGKASDAIYSLRALESFVDVTRSKRVAEFLNDASRFARRNKYIIDEAPLQIYMSALVFAPSESCVRDIFGARLRAQFDVLPKVPNQWDAEIQELEGHDDIVTVVAFSPDSQIVASGSRDTTLRLWDVATGEERQKLQHSSAVFSTAFSPDGKALTSICSDNTVRLWDVATGEEKQKLDISKVTALSPDGKTVASRSNNDTITLYNITTSEEKHTPEWRDYGTFTIPFSPDGQTIALASDESIVQLWDVPTGDKRQKLEGHDSEVMSVAFSPDRRTIATGSYDETVRLWNVSTGEERQILEGHDDSIGCLAFSPDGRIVASGSDDKTVRLWDVSTGKERQNLVGHNHWVTDVAFSPNGQILASGSWDRKVRLWDVPMAREEQKYEGHDKCVNCIAFSPDGKIAASGSDDRTVRLWDTATGEEKQRLHGHSDPIESIAFSPDGTVLASGSRDDTVRLWNPATGEEKQKLEGHDGWITAIAFSSDGKMIALGSYQGIVGLWDAALGLKMQKLRLEGHKHWVTSVAFSSDGKTMASGSRDDTIRLWDAVTGEQKQCFETGNLPSMIRFTEDGKFLTTDIGNFSLYSSPDDFDISSSPIQTCVAMESPWVKLNESDLLWLPYRYQGICSAMDASSLAIGQESGAVSFLSFKA